MHSITLYSHPFGPNPWKVALILEELGIPYRNHFIEFSDVKSPPYVTINPNGRLPAIEDPNTGVQIWESGAIVEYLIETYDKKHLISYPTTPEKWQQKQWLFFQVSGQGPPYGQAAWFQKYHPETLPSAIDRFRNELRRVNGVLENVLRERNWLVGDKCTYADLSFISWQRWATMYGGEDLYAKFPSVEAWIKRMEERSTVQKIYADQDSAIQAASK